MVFYVYLDGERYTQETGKVFSTAEGYYLSMRYCYMTSRIFPSLDDIIQYLRKDFSIDFFRDVITPRAGMAKHRADIKKAQAGKFLYAPAHLPHLHSKSIKRAYTLAHRYGTGKIVVLDRFSRTIIDEPGQ